MKRAATILAWVVAGQVVFEAVTGAYLYFNYRPTSPRVEVSLLAPDVREARRMQDLHALDSRLLVLSALAFGIVVIAGYRRAILEVAAGGWELIAVLAASFTGLLLPWDQLALRAVTVGTNLSGFQPIVRGADVRYVLIGDAHVASKTMTIRLVVHIVLGVLATVGPVVVLLRHRRSK